MDRGHLGHIRQFTFPVPDIVGAILDETQPPDSGLSSLMEPISAIWTAQREAVTRGMERRR